MCSLPGQRRLSPRADPGLDLGQLSPARLDSRCGNKTPPPLKYKIPQLGWPGSEVCEGPAGVRLGPPKSQNILIKPKEN